MKHNDNNINNNNNDNPGGNKISSRRVQNLE